METFNDVCNVLCARNDSVDWAYLEFPDLKSREDEIVNTSDLDHLKKFIDQHLDDACKLQKMMDTYVSTVLIKGSNHVLERRSEIRETLDYFLDQRCSFNTDILLTLGDEEMLEDIMSQVGVVAFIVKHYNIEIPGLEAVKPVSEFECEDLRVSPENILIALKSILADDPHWIH